MQNKNNDTIVIIAGEVSGDIIGAKIIKNLKQDYNFVGVGGENMEKEGLHSIFSISKLAVMGFLEVLFKIKTILKCINQTVNLILTIKPKVVISIDSPSFVLQVIKKVKKQNKNIKFVHIVAPQVWAWGKWRAKKYASVFDKLYTFFDFEKEFFEKYGLDCMSVGHPSVEDLEQYKHNPNKKQILLLPGSRISEVKKLLPIFKALTSKIDNFSFVISVVETTKDYVQKHIKKWSNKPKLVLNNRYQVYSNSLFAIAKSGTVSVELAMLKIPTIVIYKMNALTEFIVKLVVKIKYASLVNILSNKLIYPELLGVKKATTKNIIQEIDKILIENNYNTIKQDLDKAYNFWFKNDSPSKLITNDIKKHFL